MEQPEDRKTDTMVTYVRYFLAGALLILVAIAVAALILRDSDPEAHAQGIEEVAEREGEDVRVDCSAADRCDVTYAIDAPADGVTESDLVDRQRDVWAAIWGDTSVEWASVTLEATVEGDNASPEPILTVECDRNSANRIYWREVDAPALRTACDWEDHDPLD